MSKAQCFFACLVCFSTGCCDLVAEVVYTLNKEQLSIQEAKQLVMSFQNSKELLVSVYVRAYVCVSVREHMVTNILRNCFGMFNL